MCNEPNESSFMKKRIYKTPETLVCLLDAQSNIMLMSTSDTPAGKDVEVLINEDDFSDIWDE